MGFTLIATTATLLPHPHHHLPIPRRSLLFLSTSLTLSSTVNPSVSSIDTTITDRVFLDFTLCPTNARINTPINTGINASKNDYSDLCSDAASLGRLVIGLYGRHVPITVANFKSMCTGAAGSSYKGTLVHKIFSGRFFLAGRQGRREKGAVRQPVQLGRNTETVDSAAFVLKHLKGGVVSLCVAENDDEDEVKLDPNYRNVEFLITTGPGPCPELDYKNIVFGTVLQGMDVVAAIAAIPTYKPSERIRQFNDLAEFLGDERAQNARSIWNRPLQTVYISDCGELKVSNPSLPPSLP